jgi:(p)ppGpp synthase/HD superfamily hydrolase
VEDGRPSAATAPKLTMRFDAALLHDAAEHQGGVATPAIRDRFGADVSDIVGECSDGHRLAYARPCCRQRNAGGTARTPLGNAFPVR